MSYVVILRYGTDPGGHEYVFARTRRERGAMAERDAMVAGTRKNLSEHSGPGGRVVQGAHPTDPNAIVVVALRADGQDVFKTVTYREAAP